jgi:hypothetical protein
MAENLTFLADTVQNQKIILDIQDFDISSHQTSMKRKYPFLQITYDNVASSF